MSLFSVRCRLQRISHCVRLRCSHGGVSASKNLPVSSLLSFRTGQQRSFNAQADELKKLADQQEMNMSKSSMPESLDPSRPPVSGIWGAFVKFCYRMLGDTLFPIKADFCNCGADTSVMLPKPELIDREGIKKGSWEWKMQIYGAALYYHMAITTDESVKTGRNPDLLRGKDVLEVACMRGGGARYIAEVAGTNRYVATDNVEEHITRCQKDHGSYEGLEFQVADACHLDAAFPAESFDFVICIQACQAFSNLDDFLRGVDHVLKPGGRLLLCDAMNRNTLTSLVDAIEDNGMEVDMSMDISRHVHAVGLCNIPKGLSYTHVIARKEAN
eukprot:TRINITY_DN1748_c1_g3_i1.p1 TRINITY_DN1748_c1_g3~~TRINITY_DN1748_c1_g3_i1.p1  ORF type:complete len:329 (-),score=44.65 TRINITY_DN1748_c1_g3_i1:214-1200(-)